MIKYKFVINYHWVVYVLMTSFVILGSVHTLSLVRNTQQGDAHIII